MPSSFKISRETNNMSSIGNVLNDIFEDSVIYLQLFDGEESGDEDDFKESYISYIGGLLYILKKLSYSKVFLSLTTPPEN